MVKNRYKATIAGQVYTIIGQESKQHMDMVTVVVNEQLDKIKALAPDVDTEKAAILLAVNAVSDQLKRQEELLQMCKQQEATPDLDAYTAELESRVKKIEAVEEEAKAILRQNGQEDREIRDHVEAQQIVNENRKREIQKRWVDK